MASVLAVGVLGCGSTETTLGGDATSDDTHHPPTTAPAFPGGSGEAAKPAIAYPAGPYGINAGSIVEDFEFVGYQNPSIKTDAMQTVRLADFYNPHADDPSYTPTDAAHDDRLYPEGSIYGAGMPKPKALAIDIGSVWCPPCNQEAKTELPPKHLKYKPMGGEFLLQLGDGATQGKAAVPKDLVNWTKKYKVDFPSTIDPDYKLGELFAANAWPANAIIDTRTMRIIVTVAGVPDDAYWTKFEKVITGG
ncbi:MAG: hypothetical protein ABJE95_25700 [Byssovorax sp.]